MRIRTLAPGQGRSPLSLAPLGLSLVALLLAFVGLGAASAQAAEGRQIFGVATSVAYSDYETAWGGSRVKELDLVKGMGVQWVRLDLAWRAAEPSRKGSFDSAYLRTVDSVVDAAVARGLNVLMVNASTPSWANGGQSWRTPPMNPQDYADFLTAMATRYRGKVKAWEIWNEPNHPEFWGGSPNAADYVRLLKASYPAVKAGDSQALVVSAGLANGWQFKPFEFISAMYAAGAKGSYDVFGYHIYPDGPPDEWQPDWPTGSFAQVDKKVRVMMSAQGDSSPVWLTEVGYSTWTGDWLSFTEDKQASYLKRAYEKVRDEYPFVGVMFWYNMRNEGSSLTNFVQNLGLLRYDYSPKPAYDAYREVAGAGTIAPTTTTTTIAPTTTTIAPTTTTTVAPTTTTTVSASAQSLPVIQFVKPQDGAIVRGRVAVEVKASALAGILKVELIGDRALVGTDRSAPYTFTWDARKIAAGDHTLLAVAYDNVGNVAGTAITVKSVTNGQTQTKAAISASSYSYSGTRASVSSTGVLYVE